MCPALKAQEPRHTGLRSSGHSGELFAVCKHPSSCDLATEQGSVYSICQKCVQWPFKSDSPRLWSHSNTHQLGNKQTEVQWGLLDHSQERHSILVHPQTISKQQGLGFHPSAHMHTCTEEEGGGGRGELERKQTQTPGSSFKTQDRMLSGSTTIGLRGFSPECRVDPSFL